jgi:dipeptidyl aminopeptidase/acylaminoacyl peptidase
LVKLTDILPRLIVTGGEEMNQLLQDKDLNFYYSYRYIIDVIALRNSKISELADIDVPIIILHGKNDLLVFSEVSKAFFKEINNKQKKIKLFDCDHWFYDAVFYNQFSTKYSEESRKQITRTIIEWIDNK